MIDQGGSVAGESARREYERIRDARRSYLRDNRGMLLTLGGAAVIGGAVASQIFLQTWWIGALFGLLIIVGKLVPTQREVAWRKGAEGEQAVGRALDDLGSGARALHDRQIPGSKANIDHILIVPTGVWTVDAKNYTGKIEVRRRGRELWVKGRNRSKLLEQARRQATVVRSILEKAGLPNVPVTPTLCFLGVEWPLLFAPKRAGDVRLVSSRGLPKLIDGEIALSARQVQRVTELLDGQLRPATDTADVSEGTAPVHEQTQPLDTRQRATQPVALVVKDWKRYGKHRLYVNRPDGTALGYVDRQTNEVVPADEVHRDVIARAVADHLRGS